MDLFFPPTQRAYCSDAVEEIHTAVIISDRAPMKDDKVAFRSASCSNKQVQWLTYLDRMLEEQNTQPCIFSEK